MRSCFHFSKTTGQNWCINLRCTLTTSYLLNTTMLWFSIHYHTLRTWWTESIYSWEPNLHFFESNFYRITFYKEWWNQLLFYYWKIICLCLSTCFIELNKLSIHSLKYLEIWYRNDLVWSIGNLMQRIMQKVPIVCWASQPEYPPKFGPLFIDQGVHQYFFVCTKTSAKKVWFGFMHWRLDLLKLPTCTISFEA